MKEETKKRRATRVLSPREQAKADGKTRYLSPDPCKRGHFSERLVVNGMCSECAKLRREAREAVDPSIKERKKEYRKKNAERYRTHHRNRKQKQIVSGTHTWQDILDILTMQKGKCAYCAKNIQNKYHVDHIVPISQGGENSRKNLQLTCRSCNLQKWAHDPIYFAQKLGKLL